MKSKDQAEFDFRRGTRNAAIGAGEDWMTQAFDFLCRYAKQERADFLAEEVVAAAFMEDLPLPRDGRAWGPVFMRAKNAGVIKKIGYAPSSSSNLSPKCLWRKI